MASPFEIIRVNWRRIETPIATSHEPLVHTVVGSVDVRCGTCRHTWTAREGDGVTVFTATGQILVVCASCEAHGEVVPPDPPRE